MIFFKKQPKKAVLPHFEGSGEGEDNSSRTQNTPFFEGLLGFNEYRYKIDGGIRANLIKWSTTFKNIKEGKDAFWLINRNRRKGIFPVFVGHTKEGKEITLDFEGRHTLVCGTSRWGKTNFLRQLLLELMHWNHPQYLRIGALDAKKVGFVEASNLIDVRGGYQDSKAYLAFLAKELERRKALFPLFGCSKLKDSIGKKGLTPRTPPFLVVVLDEYAQFLAEAEIDKDGKAVREQLHSLASQGLAFGISLVLATQTPSQKILDNMIKNNIATKIFFNMEHENAWQYLTAGAKKHAIQMRQGDFLMSSEIGLQRGRTILVDDSPFKIACQNIKRNGKDFRIFK